MGIEWKAVALGMVFASVVGSALAHGDEHDAKAGTTAVKAEQKSFGIAGDPRRVSRTVTVDMSDAMRFSPAVLQVKRGETVRFVLRNKGKVMHEMVLGTLDELKEHAELMKKFPDMEHDAPYMAHVKPGAMQELVWQFNRPGEFYYGCLITGHFEAGMVGKVTVK